MSNLTRQSPVRFTARPAQSGQRDHWTVIKAYTHEGSGPWLVDLSHCTRWDLQDGRIDERSAAGVPIPSIPGRCHWAAPLLISRLNRTQAAIWHLSDRPAPELPAEAGYTDVSEAALTLALLGPKVFAIAEKLSALDLLDPQRPAPFLLQGPFSHVPCRIVTLVREADGSGVLLISCARGYAHDMVQAVLTAGAAFGLNPAGEARFVSRLALMPSENPNANDPPLINAGHEV
jgi:hypothetical protein